MFKSLAQLASRLHSLLPDFNSVRRRNALILSPGLRLRIDRARQDRVRQPSNSGQGYGAVCRYFFGCYRLAMHHTATGNCTAPVARIEQAANVLIFLFRLWPEYRVDFVKEDRWRRALTNLAE
jgi:hypothetical protein